MPTQVLNITFPALMLCLIIGVAVGRRRFRVNGWFLAAAAGFSCTAIAVAFARSGYHASVWTSMSGLYFGLALSSKRRPAAKDSEAKAGTPASLTKDERQQ
ncbi:hypothetical protein [Streptomyces griseorubiginosus]|uniref:hypothetical protein n=1 Tax=Streptomyces griseorubiginosus TaxID=67304 RepID=UPI0036EE48A3